MKHSGDSVGLARVLTLSKWSGDMSKHIGIVGCSAEGAALCYRTICQEGSMIMGAHRHPEVTMHTPSLSLYVQALERGDTRAVADLMLDSARRLLASGAQVLICPDNTIHQAFELVRPASPLPWLHIAEVVAQAASLQGWSKLGLLGTQWLLSSQVYPEKLASYGLQCVRPSSEDSAECSRIIMDELVAGEVKPQSKVFLHGLVQQFKQQQCQAVILACTELPLILGESETALPLLDSTRLLARAALHLSLQAPAERSLSSSLQQALNASI